MYLSARVVLLVLSLSTLQISRRTLQARFLPTTVGTSSLVSSNKENHHNFVILVKFHWSGFS